MKKPLATLAVVLIGMFSGGVALALTMDRPASTPSTESTESSESMLSDAPSTESTESTESGESGESTESGESGESTESDESAGPDSSSDASTAEHPDNHGAVVSKAAHECPHGPGGVHGKCVSAVAHSH